MKKLLLYLMALLTAATTWASTFTVTNSGSTFTITRSSSSGTESVYYRTVSLSAIAGVHFTEAVGILEFLEGETQKTVTVTETPIGSIAEQYLFQTGTTRTYRFEVLDPDGLQLDYINRDITYGSDYQHTANYVNRSVTDLVYFDNSGNIKSGSGNKYLDVAYSSTAWIKVTDDGYPQGVHTISTDGLYHGSSPLRTYLNNQGNKMYATVYFTQKEEEDGYQYIQILADNSTTYDDNDPRGLVNDPSISLYKACFEMRVTDGFVTDEHYQFFPHRYDYVNKAAEIAAGLSNYSFDYDNSYLYQQKYQSSSVNAPNTGSLDLETTVNNLDIRFDAGGYDKDDWDFKDLKVRLALVDNTAPTVLDNYKVSGGPHFKGNTIYVSVPFSEIVTGGGATTLNTTWGTLNYAGGSGSNVLTFSGTISNDAGGTFSVNSYSGTINDLAGNFLSGSISHNFGISLDSLYSITYDLAGGTLPEGQSNPEAYTKMTATFTLNNPTRPGYTFTGWTGSNGDTPQTTVTIEHGSEGDRSYTANWERLDLDRFYTFDSETGTLALLWGEFNNTDKWGDEVTASAVTSVTATSEVSFTGNCSYLFFGFTICTSMDLSNVNTSGMTNAANMFQICSGLTTLDLSGWNTGNVTDMSCMFYSSKLTTLDLSGWNTGNVTDMGYMFYCCYTLTSLDLSGFNTANVTNMSKMFFDCEKLTTLDLSGFNTANVTNMSNMFSDCYDLTTIYASEEWSTENVSNSSNMFSYCNKLVGGMGTTYDQNYTDKTYARIDGGLDNPGYFTAKNNHYTFDSTTGALALLWGEFNNTDKWGDEVTASAVTSVTATSEVSFTGNCSYLFSRFSNCVSMDLNNVNTSEMTNCNGMFFNCANLTSLDLSGWNTANVTNISDMFSFCSSLTTIYAGEDWSTGSVIFDYDMFRGCTSLVGGMGTTFDPNYTDKTYAHIDGGPSNPGYFTAKTTALRGDVNGDGQVKISDVTALINYLLSGDASAINLQAADCNEDGQIKISDVTALINYLLSGNW